MAGQVREEHLAEAEDKEARCDTHWERLSHKQKSRKKKIETRYVWLPTLGNHKDLVRQVKELRQAGFPHIQLPLLGQLSTSVLHFVCDFFKRKKFGKNFFISTSVVVPEEPAVVVRLLEELYLDLGERPVDLLLLENPVGLRGSNYAQIYNKSKDEPWPVRRLFQRGSDGQLIIRPNIMQNLTTVWRLLETEVIKRGLVMHLGLRNFTLTQIQELLHVVKLKPIIVQVELNLYFRQKKLRSFCSKNDIRVCAIYPFGNPFTNDSKNLPSLTHHRSVKSIAHKLDTSRKAVLLRYLLVNNIPVVIDNSMALRAAHLIQTTYEIKLDARHVEKLSAVQQTRPERVLTELELWQKKFPLWPFYIEKEEEECSKKKTIAGRNDKESNQIGVTGSIFPSKDTYWKGKTSVKN